VTGLVLGLVLGHYAERLTGFTEEAYEAQLHLGDNQLGVLERRVAELEPWTNNASAYSRTRRTTDQGIRLHAAETGHDERLQR
jgi:hypothetical protein